MSVNRRIRTIAVVGALLLTGACSAQGEQAEEPTTTTTASSTSTTETEITTTTDEGADTTTTEPEDEDGTPSLAELEATLPSAEDLGAVWTEVEPSGESLVSEYADACPQIAPYVDDDDEESVRRTYEDADGFRFELVLDRDPGVFADRADVERMIEDYRDCTLEFEDAGITFVVTFDGVMVPDMGENGVMMKGGVVASTPDGDIEFNVYNLGALTENGVKVTTSTQDLVGRDNEVQPVNSDLFPQLVSGVVGEVEAL